jgi:hypothetical protein
VKKKNATMLMHFSLCQLEDKLNVKREVMSVPAYGGSASDGRGGAKEVK